MLRKFTAFQSRAIYITVGFLFGFLVLFGIHFFTAASEDVHYHANFAFYVNGDQDEFDNFTFYEEIQACNPANGVRPESRAHMHEMVNHVVHVHDEGVTWGHFFANLGYTLGNDTVITNDGAFVDGDGAELTFILNGQRTRSIANQLIGDQDRLLINYGDEGEDEISERFEQIPTDAAEYNEKDDPASCAGESELTLADRLRKAIGL